MMNDHYLFCDIFITTLSQHRPTMTNAKGQWSVRTRGVWTKIAMLLVYSNLKMNLCSGTTCFYNSINIVSFGRRHAWTVSKIESAGESSPSSRSYHSNVMLRACEIHLCVSESNLDNVNKMTLCSNQRRNSSNSICGYLLTSSHAPHIYAYILDWLTIETLWIIYYLLIRNQYLQDLSDRWL